VIADLAWQRLKGEPARVPAIWWFEVRNVLLTNERRRTIPTHDTAEFPKALSAMEIETDHAPSETATLALARAHNLTICNASDLALALRDVLPLATLDTKFGAAAKREGVRLLG
jgi:predicted nucleic acid-binding protein